jgi:hypothetical protein
MWRALVCALVILPHAAAADAPAPMRPLPQPSTRPAAKAAVLHVDPKGDDANDGSAAKPWKTIAAAAKKLKPGATLYLHGGVYYESVALTVAGTPDAPITIRSAPGELAILDGGLREFAEAPKTAWEPVPQGASSEYRSTASYSDLGVGDKERVVVTGNFAASMVPLHGYKWDADLRTDNQLFNITNTAPGTGMYVGPGVWFDRQSHRIHIRLAHGTLKSQGAAPGIGNYVGPTDPRTLPLVIGTDRIPLAITKSKHVRIQDLVVRGAASRTVAIEDSANIELDGVTVYGGSPAMFVKSTSHFRLVRSTLRGLAAPWSSRASMKYRGASPYLFIASSQAPQSVDWEIAYCEFTDGHDGVVIDSIKTLRFHHNRLDNFNDDGLYLTLPPREVLPDDVQIYENVFTRVYTTLAFAEHKVPSNPIGTGVYIFRNIFDLREGTYGWIPKDAATDDKPLALLASRVCGDHGSPTWEPLYFYNNTVVTAGTTWRSYYGALLGVMGTKGTKRRVFDNIFVQLDGDPGLSFQGADGDDIQVDGNLLWSVANGPTFRGDFFAKHRGSRAFEASKQTFAPGWAAHDLYADPRFVDLAHGDVRLAGGSAAIDAGVAVPAAWPDTLRKLDKGAPDVGALPVGAPMLRVGPAAQP